MPELTEPTFQVKDWVSLRLPSETTTLTACAGTGRRRVNGPGNHATGRIDAQAEALAECVDRKGVRCLDVVAMGHPQVGGESHQEDFHLTAGPA